jgi:membrane peptidoglycan carboxypeptidase
VRPGDGAVVAMYGGADYSKSQFNTSTQAIMQGASNFKPFAVLAAVREGISTKTKFSGDQPQEIDGTKITNFGARSYGMVDMRRMIGRSINTAFVNLNKEVTPAKTRQAAVDAGIPAKTPGMDDTLTNVLGTASPHVIDMASAYSTIAAQGVRSKPYLVAKVTSTEGDFSYEAKPETKRAFDKDVTADVTDAMTYTVKPGGTATKLQQLGRPVAGKTGTSSQAKSIWFSGFVPQLAVSVGMYKPDAKGNPQTLTDNEDTNLTGGTVPADVFYDFMKVALQGVEVQDFPKRAGVGDDKIAAATPTATFTQGPTQTQTPTATVTVPATTTVTTTQAPPPTTTQAPPPTTSRPTKTKPGKPTPTGTSSPTSTAAGPAPTPTKPGKGP